jgi:hypothetical protein
MGPKPDNLAFRFVVVLALVAVTIVAITTWALHQKRASASATPSSEVIYRPQHLNLF